MYSGVLAVNPALGTNALAPSASNRLATSTFALTGEYNVLKGRYTPYVSGNLDENDTVAASGISALKSLWAASADEES